MMDHYIQEHDGVVVISPQGDLQAETIGSFQSRTDELLKTGVHYFVIDFSSVNFIDSSGLAALVRLYKRVRIGEGDVRLAEVPTAIMKILKLTRLSRVFDTYPTISDAVASMK